MTTRGIYGLLAATAALAFATPVLAQEDPFESSGLDELREVVGRLGTAHAAELLIGPASQLWLMPVVQGSQRPLLGGLEFLTSGSRHHSP